MRSKLRFVENVLETIKIYLMAMKNDKKSHRLIFIKICLFFLFLSNKL